MLSGATAGQCAQPLFDTAPEGYTYDWFHSDLVTENPIYKPELTTAEACGCGCAEDLSCDGWMFYAPGNPYNQWYPGCSWENIVDFPGNTPCIEPQSDVTYPGYYSFHIRPGKYTDIKNCFG